MTLNFVIEALLFASPKPLGVPEIVEILRGAAEKSPEGPEHELAGADAERVKGALEELAEEYRNQPRGYLLLEQANGWGLVTNPDAASWVRRLYPEAKPTRLSGPALETLAIIAYRQPVTRADVEVVRGVAVDGVMQVLLDRGLVRVAGRAEVPGRPLLYATTEYFLQHFGLKTTDELPNASELKRIPLPTAPPPEEGGKATKPAKGAKLLEGEQPPEPAPEAPTAAAVEAVPAPEVAPAAEQPKAEVAAAEAPPTEEEPSPDVAADEQKEGRLE